MVCDTGPGEPKWLTGCCRCTTWSDNGWVHVRHGSWGEAVGVGASGLGGFGGGFGFFQPEVTNGNVDLKWNSTS